MKLSSPAFATTKPIPDRCTKSGAGGQPPLEIADVPHHYFFWLYAPGTAVSGKPNRQTFLREYATDLTPEAVAAITE